MDHSLLLSAGYEPVKVIPWKKAITLVVLGKVEVLEEYDKEVHSPTVTYRLPSVIKLNRFFKPIPRKVKFSRHNLFSRDNYTCQYCHKTFPAHQLTYDHVVPRSKGGNTTWTNVVTSCQRCNLRKGNKPLHALNVELLNKPVEPRWVPEFMTIMDIDHTPNSWANYLFFGRR